MASTHALSLETLARTAIQRQQLSAAEIAQIGAMQHQPLSRREALLVELVRDGLCQRYIQVSRCAIPDHAST